MSSPAGSDEKPTAAERALSGHLELLRTSPPVARHSLVTRILRTARWQRAVRHPVLVVAALAGAVLTGARLLFSGRRR